VPREKNKLRNKLSLSATHHHTLATPQRAVFDDDVVVVAVVAVVVVVVQLKSGLCLARRLWRRWNRGIA